MKVDRFILNPLASGDVILTNEEREAGVMVVDIGGGDRPGDVHRWRGVAPAVIAVDGHHITNDTAAGLPFELAEAVKLEYGHADPKAVSPLEAFPIQPFGEELPSKVQRADLAHIINARVAEIFELIMQEAKRSGYDGLLKAGIVLTGGSSLLPGIKTVASEVLRMPVRGPAGEPDRHGRGAEKSVIQYQRGIAKTGPIMDLEMIDASRCARMDRTGMDPISGGFPPGD